MSPALETQSTCDDLSANGKPAGSGCLAKRKESPKQCLVKHAAFISLQKAREPTVRAVSSSGLRVENYRQGQSTRAHALPGGRRGGCSRRSGGPVGWPSKGAAQIPRVGGHPRHFAVHTITGSVFQAQLRCPGPSPLLPLLGLSIWWRPDRATWDRSAQLRAGSSVSNRHPNTCFSC